MPMPTIDRDVATPATLADVLAELVAIRRLLEERPRPAPLSRADGARLARLLPALGAAFGSEVFASRDVLDDPGARVVLRGCSVKQVGRLLARGVGVPIDGLLIERAGLEINLRVWRVVRSLS